MGRTPRDHIGKKARFEVFKRDGFTCQYCGDTPPAAILHVDHVIPAAEGGPSDQDNLVTSCSNCNPGKGARLLSSVPLSLAEKAREIAEREEQLRGYQDILRARRDRIEDDSWEVAESLFPGSIWAGLRQRYFLGIKVFVERLGKFDVLEAADIALSRKYGGNSAFRYFCGICWNKIREREANGA